MTRGPVLRAGSGVLGALALLLVAGTLASTPQGSASAATTPPRSVSASAAASSSPSNGAATGAPVAARAPETREPGQDVGRATDFFNGFLIPANATEIFTPEASFRLMGWTSWGGSLKLLELAPDGSQVKKGDVIARFDFWGKNALQRVQENLQKCEAEAAESRIKCDQSVESLVLEQRRKGLEAKLAGINVQREHALSRRQASLNRISHRIAEFELDAVTQRLEATRDSVAAERDYHDSVLQRARANLDRYRFYERRFQIVAPHDGVVRHAFNPHERRVVQKGDQIQCGQRVLSVARDTSLAAKFFVPEHRLAEIAVGTEVTVTTAASAAEFRAVITKLDFFPQEIGFLMENDDLPNGREKAFSVLAALPDAPPELTAGTELRVKARRP